MTAHTPSHIVDTRSEAGFRAGTTIRWLEQSGPRYRPVIAEIAACHGEEVWVRLKPGEPSIPIPMRALSIASWLICQQAVKGASVALMIRTDPVGVGAITAEKTS